MKPSVRDKLPEYKHANLTGSRVHVFPVRGPSAMEADYSPLKGDELKTEILLKFKSSLVGITHRIDLIDKIEEFQASDEYRVLASSQGLSSRLFNLKSSSLKAFQKICEHALDESKGDEDSMRVGKGPTEPL